MAETFIILAVVVAFAYPLFQRWQLDRTRHVRDRFAELGKEMLGSPHYSEEHKLLISDMLEDPLDWRFMPIAVIYMPVVAMKDIFGGKPKGFEKVAELIKDDRFSEFVTLHQKSVMAANPLFAAIFRVEMAILLAFVVGFLMAPYLLLRTIVKVTPRVHDGSGACQA